MIMLTRISEGVRNLKTCHPGLSESPKSLSVDSSAGPGFGHGPGPHSPSLLPCHFPGMPMTLPLNTKVSDIHQRAQSDTTHRVARGSHSGIDPRPCTHHPLEEHRDWLRQGTTCYVVDSPAFLETFLPEVAQTRVDRIHDLLLERKLLTPQGWREFSGGTIAKVGEHHMFIEPLEEIVNQTIAILAGDEGLAKEGISGELRPHDVSTREAHSSTTRAGNPCFPSSGTSTPAADSSRICLQNDGFRSFTSERPDVYRSDGALLFMDKVKSRSKETQPAEAEQPTSSPIRKQPPRKAKIRSVQRATKLDKKGPVHLEDVVACLRFKRKYEASGCRRRRTPPELTTCTGGDHSRRAWLGWMHRPS
jgi:hypothetical protein